MTTRTEHDPCLDHIDIPPGRWLVLTPDDVIQRGDMFEFSRGDWWLTRRAGQRVKDRGLPKVYIRRIS